MKNLSDIKWVGVMGAVRAAVGVLLEMLGLVGAVLVSFLVMDAGGVAAIDAAPGTVVPDLKFYAINPGYTINKVANSGEMIVLKNMQGGMFSLAGFSIEYTNSSGKASKLLDLPTEGTIIGEKLLLRLASTGEPADLSYSKTLAMKGALKLLYRGEVVDEVCWTGAEGCFPAFTSERPKMLVRNLETMGFEVVANDYYVPNYDPSDPGVQMEEGRGEAEPPHCAGLQFSEILSYYETEAAEQFIELYNAGDEQMVLSGCSLKYKNKQYPLSGVLRAGEYLAYIPSGFTLTKNPNSQNEIAIIDTDGSVVDSFVYYNGQKKGVAMAQFGYDEQGAELWLATYRPTPGEDNDYQKYKTCEAGKVINEDTGNCVKASSLDSSLEACPEGKYRNPLTGRCKAYPKETELAACLEGYERNPETGRCRKIKTNTGADYALGDGAGAEAEMRVNFVALIAVIAVVAGGAAYVVWQFRKEIWGCVLKIMGKKAGVKRQ